MKGGRVMKNSQTIDIVINYLQFNKIYTRPVFNIKI